MIKHIFLDHCWVCRVRFTSANPPGPAQEQRHHIIPQSAGGANGPQVSLCDAHHVKLHRIAECLGKKPYHQMLVGEPTDARAKILWLATQVANAFAAVANDPNKTTVLSMTLDGEFRRHIDRLKPVLGVRSREQVIRYAIRSLYKRNFGGHG